MYCRYITGAKKMTYLGALKTAEIGFGIGYRHMPYTSAVETAGIGTAYASTSKSTGIGILIIFIADIYQRSQ